MFKSFTIENFRCFKRLALTQLEQINLIGGMNNTGKTSVLEALFLMLGANNPNLVLNINAFRGIQHFALETEIISESPWGWLFLDNRTDRSIKLTCTNEEDLNQSLEIQLNEPKQASFTPSPSGESKTPGSPSSTRALNLKELVLKYHTQGSEEFSSQISITSKGELILKRSEIPPLPPGIFCYAQTALGADDIERFSRLERLNRQDEVVTLLNLVEPRLKRLALLSQGGSFIVAGDIGIGELVPVSLMGTGMGRLLSIVLAILAAQNGVVLIDEIENGLHYSVLSKVWSGIADAAKFSNTQIFATTHSLECIRAAHQAFSHRKTYDFRYHRLERINDEIEVVTYDQETIETSIAMNFEMR